MKCLEDSLRRLKTDRIDLWQFHEMVYDNDPDWVFEKGGIKAALEARKAGKVRFIGFTGHKDPRIHLKMLAKPYDWDAAQMPINVHGRALPQLPEGGRPGLPAEERGRDRHEGLRRQATASRSGAGLTAAEAYRYALSQPVASQVVGIDHARAAQARTWRWPATSSR